MSHKPNRGRSVVIAILIVLILLMIAATAFLIWKSIDLVNQKPVQTAPKETSAVLPTEAATTPPTTIATEPPETTEPPAPTAAPVSVTATATISAQGDVLMHAPLFSSQYNAYAYKGNGEYDFSSFFQYLTDYIAACDYSLANLETTFGGKEMGYSGEPAFNSPDVLADNLAAAGYDMLLTANNHCSDTLTKGIKRTLETVRAAGLASLGTQLSDEETKYAIVDVNGIKVGMICYTYADKVNSKGNPILNGMTAVKESGLVNFFTKNNPEKLYEEVEQHLANMRSEGAEATMIFLHWGTEYELKENELQQEISQKLCDLGIDVIVGGHPHVVQPMALLESTADPSHKTVCLYSMGNAVSNQRSGQVKDAPRGYTEDGVFFTVTFEKYSDGSVYVADTNVIPTWADRHYRNGGREYNIIPLNGDYADQWGELYGLDEDTLAECVKSYDRTMGIVGEGLTACRDYLQQAKAARENP